VTRHAIGIATLLVALAATSAIGVAQGAPPATTGVLTGTIDVHVHSYPDDRPRSIHAIDVAKLAQTRGMRAIVLKNHWESTAGMAYLVRQVVPGIEVFGGIALNRTVGGINAAAVDHMARVTGSFGRIVWMPTFDAENQVRVSKESRPFVSVTKDGELLPEVKAVIGVIAKNNLVLATGHSAPAEGLMLLREGKQQGVRQMIVTHAIQTPVLMNVAQMKEAASLGAFIEFVGGNPEGQAAPHGLTASRMRFGKSDQLRRFSRRILVSREIRFRRTDSVCSSRRFARADSAIAIWM